MLWTGEIRYLLRTSVPVAKLVAKLATCTLLAAMILPGQTFENASVKRSAAENGSGARSTGAIPRQQDPTRINYPRVTLRSVIGLAYGIAADQIDGPQWLGDERYDIVATLPSNASESQVPIMLQHLLAERFALTVHEETKIRTGYALIAGKGEPKLKPHNETEGIGFNIEADHVTLRSASMAQLAKFLSSSMGRPVVDQTGIDGSFDVTLNASMADIKSGQVFSAIEDLGLKFETRKVSDKFIVVDSAAKIPTPN